MTLRIDGAFLFFGILFQRHVYRACLTVDVTETGLAVRTAALGQHTGRAFALVVPTFLLRTRRAGIGEGGTFWFNRECVQRVVSANLCHMNFIMFSETIQM